MTIVEEFKKLIASKGYNTIGVQTISDAVKVLTDIENGTAVPADDTTVPVDDGVTK